MRGYCTLRPKFLRLSANSWATFDNKLTRCRRDNTPWKHRTEGINRDTWCFDTRGEKKKKKRNERTASGFDSYDCESNRKETSPRLHMAKSSFTHNSAQGRLTPPHTGGHGRSSWAQGLRRGRNTHFPVPSLSATPPPKMLVFNYSASSSAMEDTSVIFLKPRARHGFAFPSERLCAWRLQNRGWEILREKVLFISARQVQPPNGARRAGAGCRNFTFISADVRRQEPWIWHNGNTCFWNWRK